MLYHHHLVRVPSLYALAHHPPGRTRTARSFRPITTSSGGDDSAVVASDSAVVASDCAVVASDCARRRLQPHRRRLHQPRRRVVSDEHPDHHDGRDDGHREGRHRSLRCRARHATQGLGHEPAPRDPIPFDAAPPKIETAQVAPRAPPPVERIADSFANASAVSSRSAASEVREVSASAFASPVSTSPRAPGEDFGRSDAETASASASSSGSSASAWSRRGSPRDANMLSSCFAAAPRAGSHPMPPRNPPAAPVASSCVWRSAGWEDEAPACARWMTAWEAAAGAGRCATGALARGLRGGGAEGSVRVRRAARAESLLDVAADVSDDLLDGIEPQLLRVGAHLRGDVPELSPVCRADQRGSRVGGRRRANPAGDDDDPCRSSRALARERAREVRARATRSAARSDLPTPSGGRQQHSNPAARRGIDYHCGGSSEVPKNADARGRHSLRSSSRPSANRARHHTAPRATRSKGHLPRVATRRWRRQW